MCELYFDTICVGFVFGIGVALGVALGIGFVMKVDSFLDYRKHGN